MEKERRTKALVLSALVVVVATLSIAFAAMSRTLSINGIGKMDTASWSVYFANLSNAKITRGAEEVGKPKISDDKGTVQDINVKLSNPKDEISYTVDIVNDGTIDAEITMIKDIELTEVQKKVFEFKVTYTDTGEILQNGDILSKKTTKNITINIKFKDDITEFDLPTESQTINLSYQITYTQYDGGGAIVGPNGGGVTGEKAVLASVANPENIFENEDVTEPFFNCTAITRDQVESIEFLNSNAVPTEYQANSWDASEAKDESIIGWYQPSNTEGLYDVYIGSDANIYAPNDSSGLFALFIELKTLNFNNNFNTSNVSNMQFMFFANFAYSMLDLSSFDTSNVTNMSYMFAYNCSVSNLDLFSFNTQNVIDMSDMFEGCSTLTNLNLGSFNTSNVTNMYAMFSGCSSLTTLDLSNFNTTNVTDMSCMFSYCEKLTNLNLKSFDTANVTDMGEMFLNCKLLESIDLSSFNPSSVTDMSYMFESCSSLTSLDLSSFNTSNVTDMSYMFGHCSSLITLDLRNIDFSKVTKMDSWFVAPNQLLKIIVKDETQRTWLTTKFPSLTNVVLPSEL